MIAAPDNAELIERLAAEYVLGTLRGAARQRFERWRTGSERVDERCRFWEERLPSLLAGMRPVAPPRETWPAIRARLGLPREPARRVSLRAYALAAGAAALAVIGAILYWQAPMPVIGTASIASTAGQALWQVEIRGRPGQPAQLSVSAGRDARRPDGHDYELWALPRGGAPVSLGLLPYQAGSARRALTAAQRTALASAAQLAVSVEPPGGSPTGAPTGAVVFVAGMQPVG